RASAYLQALAEFQPAIYAACCAAMAGSTSDMHFTRIDALAFAACPENSIDYAVMEPLCSKGNGAGNALMVPLDAGWSDIGSWSALWQVSDKDAEGNVLRGDV